MCVRKLLGFAQFEEAEQIQKAWRPAEPLLYSFQGFQYCDLLLDQGRPRATSLRAARGPAYPPAWRVVL